MLVPQSSPTYLRDIVFSRPGNLWQKQPKFWEEMLTVGNFAVDVLLATRMVLRNTSVSDAASNGLFATMFKDPFTGDWLQLM